METLTYEDFYKFLGVRPARLGIVSRLYPELTSTYLTESLANVYYNDSKSKNKFQGIDAMVFEWQVDVNNIKRIEFAAVPDGNGADGSEITFYFRERYYDKYDIFKIDETHQQIIVVSHPIRRADNFWSVQGRILDSDYSSILDLSGVQPGMTSRFQSVAMPELSEEGHVKYQSDVNKFRNYLTTFRVDTSYSSLFAAQEQVFINIATGKNQGALTEVTYKMEKKEKTLLDNFMYARNSGLLFNKSDIDKFGKPTVIDPDTNRPIYIGDGLIPQIERYASKYAYNKLTVSVFNQIIASMNEKAERPTGNVYVFVVNEALWNQVNQTLGDWLAKFKTDGAFLYSKAANGYVDVGATFLSYEFAGNKVLFRVDRSLTREYGNKGYGICIDLTADKTSAEPPVAMFSLKGGEMISSKYPGVGGMSGLESGIVSSPVAGSKLILMGYAGIAVFNPYRSFLLREC